MEIAKKCKTNGLETKIVLITLHKEKELYKKAQELNIFGYVLKEFALEEMEIPYEVKAIRLDKGEQKEPWYVALNPNGRIPTIVDHDENDFAVFETGAIMMYLAEKSGKFRPIPLQLPNFSRLLARGSLCHQGIVLLRTRPLALNFALAAAAAAA